MNYTSLWEMRLGHFCLLCAIYVFFFFFLNTLSLVIPLSLLISISFLKPLSIVFQDGIWSVCFNVVVCARIQRRKKKKNSKKRKRKSVKKKKTKRVLIKFWEVKCKEGVLHWRRRVIKKKMLNGNSKKSWHSHKSWKPFLLFTFTHFHFVPFAFTLHYVLIKSLFDIEDCVV